MLDGAGVDGLWTAPEGRGAMLSGLARLEGKERARAEGNSQLLFPNNYILLHTYLLFSLRLLFLGNVIDSLHGLSCRLS